MTLKISFLLIISTLLFSCRKHTSDDQITKTQLRNKVQQNAQNMDEEQMAKAFEKKEPEFKEKVIALIFEALDSEIVNKIFSKPKAQAALKKLFANQENLVNVLKQMSEEDLNKLIIHPEVQRILLSVNPNANVTQLGAILSKLPPEELEKIADAPEVQELILSVVRKPEVRTKIISSMTEADLVETLNIPSVQLAMEKEMAKIITKNNLAVDRLITIGDGVFNSLKVTYKRKAGVTNVVAPKTSDLYLKFSVDVKYKKYSCEKIADADTYWSELLILTSNKQNLLGVGANFFEQMIKSCLTYERLKSSMQKCQSPHLEEIEALCKSSL